MKRIAIVLQTPRDQHSSVLLTYEALSVELKQRGFEMTLITPQDFPGARRFMGRLTPFVYPVSVARWMRRHRGAFDVVVFHSYAGWLAAAIGATRGTTEVVSFHGLEPMYHRELLIEAGGRLSTRYRILQERLMPMFLRIACRHAARVTCLNQAERQYLVDHRWARPDQVIPVAHSVHDRFFIEPRPPRPVRTILTVAQWQPMKGIAALSAAFAELARRHPALELVCAGTLFDADHVKSYFPEDVRARVTILARVEHAKFLDVYRRADVFVLPSSYEGFGVAILEAMAARLPIVVTPTGVAGDALTDRESAMIVPPRDAAALARAIDELIADDRLRLRIAEGARAAAETYRDATRIAEWADAITRFKQPAGAMQ